MNSETVGDTRRYNFRLPQRTIDQLDEMVNKGIVRSRTEGIILATERFQISKTEINKEDLKKTLKEIINEDSEIEEMILDIIRKQMFPERTNTSKTKKQESQSNTDKDELPYQLRPKDPQPGWHTEREPQ